MNMGDSRKQKAIELFSQGYNCAQAILAVYGAEFGLEREHAMKIGAPFGGGIANTGDVCGAVTGAIMVIGLKYGDTSAEGWFKRARLYRTARIFMEKFSQAGGSIKCEKIKIHLADRHKNVQRDTHCSAVVENAAGILENLL